MQTSLASLRQKSTNLIILVFQLKVQFVYSPLNLTGEIKIANASTHFISPINKKNSRLGYLLGGGQHLYMINLLQIVSLKHLQPDLSGRVIFSLVWGLFHSSSHEF